MRHIKDLRSSNIYINFTYTTFYCVEYCHCVTLWKFDRFFTFFSRKSIVLTLSLANQFTKWVPLLIKICVNHQSEKDRSITKIKPTKLINMCASVLSKLFIIMLIIKKNHSLICTDLVLYTQPRLIC